MMVTGGLSKIRSFRVRRDGPKGNNNVSLNTVAEDVKMEADAREDTQPGRCDVSNRNLNAQLSHQVPELKEAYEKFQAGDLDEALGLFLISIPMVQENLRAGDPLIGDINVKISTILQSSNELEDAIKHLNKANSIYARTYKKTRENDKRIILAEKAIDVKIGIGNIYLEMGDMEKALKSLEESLTICKNFFPEESFELCKLVNIYANVKSVCTDEKKVAIQMLEEAHKIAMRITDNKPSVYSASLLDTMGKIYMRRTPNSVAEALKFCTSAENCFMKSIKEYRYSKTENGNDKIAELLCNLMQTKNRISTLKEDLAEISKNVQDSKQKNITKDPNTILSKDLCESESDADDNYECGSEAGSDVGSDNRSEIGSTDGEGSTVGDDEISAASSHDMKGAEKNGFFNFFFPFVNTSKEYYSWDEGSQGSYYSDEEENASEEQREDEEAEKN